MHPPFPDLIDLSFAIPIHPLCVNYRPPQPVAFRCLMHMTAILYYLYYIQDGCTQQGNGDLTASKEVDLR